MKRQRPDPLPFRSTQRTTGNRRLTLVARQYRARALLEELLLRLEFEELTAELAARRFASTVMTRR